jgi:hypothetical protein
LFKERKYPLQEWFNAVRLGIKGTGAFFLGDSGKADRLRAKAMQA